jgi:hypothetical protein
MPIAVEDGEKVITDERLTSVCIINELYKRRQKEIAALIKANLTKKKAAICQSSIGIARLKEGGVQTSIDPQKAFKELVLKRKMPWEQFLELVTVKKEPLGKHLSENEIEAIEIDGKPREDSLTPELKPGITLDLNALEDLLVKAARGQLKAA